MSDLTSEVIFLVLAEGEDLSHPVYRRWLRLCQERTAAAALAEVLDPEQALRVDLAG